MAWDSGFLKDVFVPRDSRNARLLRAGYAEFLGTLLFQFLVGFTNGDALAAGLSYGILIFSTQQVSGGHLNPAITLAATLSGHFNYVTSIVYIIAQIVGAAIGAMLQVALVPGIHWGQQPASPGCYDPNPALTGVETWAWETVLTFVLIYVVYATAIASPGHGSLSPLAIGLTVYVATVAGGNWTGASLNPARVLAGLIVYGCNLHGIWWIYLLGQIVGAILASAVAASIFGWGNGAYTSEGDRRDPLLSREGENV
jgi:aquaporin TIP